jgi:hypothetical protein
MKKIFTLFALAASTAPFAQTSINETFETNTLSQLESNCWQFSGAAIQNGAALTGSLGLYVIPATSSSASANSNSGEIRTPFLDFTNAQTISFNYRLTGSGGSRFISLKFLDKNGTLSTSFATINLTATVKTAAIANIPAGSGIKRLVIEILGSGGGNVAEHFDDLVITAPLQYSSFCNLAPTAGNDTYTANTLTSYSGTTVLSNDSDPNGETLTPSVVTSPNGTVVMNADGTFTFTPNAAFTGGPATFTYSVTDNGYLPLTATATVTINYPSAASLPIKLTNFNGLLNSGNAQLTWTVEDNETGNYFEVQKSSDGNNFIPASLLFVTSTIGKENYKYSEELKAATYYRLKIVNKDNSISYSKVVYLKDQADTANEKITMLQNPIQNNTLRFSFTSASAEAMSVTLYNMAGVAVYTTPIVAQKGLNVVNLTMNSDINYGQYLLDLRTSTMRRIIKVTR